MPPKKAMSYRSARALASCIGCGSKVVDPWNCFGPASSAFNVDPSRRPNNHRTPFAEASILICWSVGASFASPIDWIPKASRKTGLRRVKDLIQQHASAPSLLIAHLINKVFLLTWTVSLLLTRSAMVSSSCGIGI